VISVSVDVNHLSDKMRREKTSRNHFHVVAIQGEMCSITCSLSPLFSPFFHHRGKKHDPEPVSTVLSNFGVTGVDFTPKMIVLCIQHQRDEFPLYFLFRISFLKIYVLCCSNRDKHSLVFIYLRNKPHHARSRSVMLVVMPEKMALFFYE